MKIYSFYLKIQNFLIISLIILLLYGCGFHLQGLTNLPPQLHTIFINTKAPYSPLIHQLKSNLRYSGVQITEDPKKAPIHLNIISENLTTTQTSIGTSQQMRDYTVTYTVQFNIEDMNGNLISGPSSVSDSRTITTLANELITNSNKLPATKSQMTHTIVSKILFHLSAEKTVKALLIHMDKSK